MPPLQWPHSFVLLPLVLLLPDSAAVVYHVKSTVCVCMLNAVAHNYLVYCVLCVVCHWFNKPSLSQTTRLSAGRIALFKKIGLTAVILYRPPVPALQVLEAVVRLLVEDRMGGSPWAGVPWGPYPLQVMVFNEH